MFNNENIKEEYEKQMSKMNEKITQLTNLEELNEKIACLEQENKSLHSNIIQLTNEKLELDGSLQAMSTSKEIIET